MQNSRDSSVLRSLAAAFGDGLAFGAGMKLTRGVGRSAALEGAPAIDITPLLEQLAEIEKRIGKVERAPVAIAPPPFDQKVIEAIVNALDARMLEQAGQVERRLSEMEAKLAVELKSLLQDRETVSGIQTQIEELNGQFNDQLAAIRLQSDEERAAMQREISALPREFAMEAVQAVGDRVAQMRTEIASRDGQIAELRARLDASEQNLRNVVGAIAQACQTAVAQPAPTAQAEPEPAPEPSAGSPLPSFAQPKTVERIVPISLAVSVGLVSAAGLAMLHYL